MSKTNQPDYVCSTCSLGVLVLPDNTKIRGCSHTTAILANLDAWCTIEAGLSLAPAPTTARN